MPLIKSFHNTIDSARMYQIYTGSRWKTYPVEVTFRNRSLSYLFFPHFHPYVPALIQRLDDGGFPELQDSDTLYLPQPNPPSGQPFQPLTPSVIGDSVMKAEEKFVQLYLLPKPERLCDHSLPYGATLA